MKIGRYIVEGKNKRNMRVAMFSFFLLLGVTCLQPKASATVSCSGTPSTPPTPTVSASSVTQINISGYTITDSDGISSYNILRCSGSGCTPVAYTNDGGAGSFSDTGLTPGTLYRYTIEAVDVCSNVSPPSSIGQATTLTDSTPPTVTAFTLPTTATSLTVPISTFTATDNVGVTAWMVKETATNSAPTAPLSGDSGWQTTGISGTTSATITGNITASTSGTRYFWAYTKDAAGNVSSSVSATTTITLDTTPPTVTAFTIPSTYTSGTVPISTFTATDNISVTGYCVTTTTNSSSGCTWTSTAPTSITFGGGGAQTAYAWAKDAAGNISTSVSATITVYAYAITITTPTNGTISCSPTTSIPAGSNSVCTITPSSNYYISGITVDGVSVGSQMSTSALTYTFSNVTANHTIAATFAASSAILSQSTYTSSPIAFNSSLGFNTINWAPNLPGTSANVLEMRMRSCDTSGCNSTNETTNKPWTSCGLIANTTGAISISASPSLASGTNCLTPGDGYLQYQVVMATTDSTNKTVPTFGPVSITNNSGYSTSWQSLVSSPFDSGNAYTGISSLGWNGGAAVGAGTAVKFQMRTAPENSAGTGPDWTNANASGWCGTSLCSQTMGTGTEADGYYYKTTLATINALQANASHNTGNRWVQYAVFMQATDGTSATLPTAVTNVTTSFSFNSPPVIAGNTAGTIPPIVSQITSGADASKVKATYYLSDIDVGSGDAPSTSDYQMLLYQPDGVSLGASIGLSDNTIVLNNTNNRPYPVGTSANPAYVMIDNELIKYTTAPTSNTIAKTVTLNNVAREVDLDDVISSYHYPTFATTHSAGAAVFFVTAPSTTTFSSGGAVNNGVTATPTQYSITWNAASEPNMSAPISGTSVSPWTNWNFEVVAADGNYGTDIGTSTVTTLATLDLQPPTITSAVAGGSGKTLADNAFINSNIINLKMSEPLGFLTTPSNQVAQISFTPTAGGSAITNTLTTGNCSAISTSAQALTIPGLTTNTSYNVVIQGLDLFGNAFVQPHSTTTFNNVTYDTTAPYINSIQAATGNKSYALGAQVLVNVIMSEKVSSSNAAWSLTLLAGSNTRTCVGIPVAIGSETSTLTCTYTVQSGDDTTNLFVKSGTGITGYGNILDQAGNPMTNNGTGADPGKIHVGFNDLSQSGVVIDTHSQEKISGTVGANGSVKFQ